MGISYANLATLSERLIRENGRDALLIAKRIQAQTISQQSHKQAKRLS